MLLQLLTIRHLRATLLLLAALPVPACDESQRERSPPPPAVTVARPILREIVEWDKYTGRLRAVRHVEVRARVSGYLQAIRFKEGQVVEKGAPLFLIDPRPYQAVLDQATARKAQAQARLDLARVRVRRAAEALAKNAIATDDYDVIAAEEKQAVAEIHAADALVTTAELELEFTEVHAPISGRISRYYVTEGNLVNGGTAQSTLLTTIVSLDPIHCYFDADERALLKYTRLAKSGARPSSRDVANPVLVALADETGFPHVGRMDFVDNRVDEDAGTIVGRAIIPNPDGLSGMLGVTLFGLFLTPVFYVVLRRFAEDPERGGGSTPDRAQR